MGLDRNILVGAASLYLAASGTAKPAYGAASVKYTTTLDALTATWPNVGYTTDGVEISYQPDYGEVPVDQLLDAALLFKQAMTVSLNTTFAEATLDNLKIVWGQTDATLKTTGTGFDGETIAAGEKMIGLQAGSLGGAPTERQMIAVGAGPRAVTTLLPAERNYYARRVLSVDTSAHSLARDNATVFPVSFRLLPDGTKTNAEYGSIYDRLTT
jgi:hypothetical protein